LKLKTPLQLDPKLICKEVIQEIEWHIYPHQLFPLDVASHLHELVFFKVSRKPQRQIASTFSKFIIKHVSEI